MGEIERRIEVMGRAEFSPENKIAIIGVLDSEGATGLSDSEIERCLGRCAGGAQIIRRAKKFRDCEFITESDLKTAKSERVERLRRHMARLREAEENLKLQIQEAEIEMQYAIERGVSLNGNIVALRGIQPLARPEIPPAR